VGPSGLCYTIGKHRGFMSFSPPYGPLDELCDDRGLVSVEIAEARMNYLYKWANEHWESDIWAPQMEARAQYIEYKLAEVVEDDDGNIIPDMVDGWEPSWMDCTESLLEYHMVLILQDWLDTSPEESYKNRGYNWMLWAVGYDKSHTYHDYVIPWLVKEGHEHFSTEEIEEICWKIGCEPEYYIPALYEDG